MRFLCGAVFLVVAAAQIPQISPGGAISGALARGETKWYSVRLDAGQFCSAVLEQRDADLGVTVLDPSGATVANFDGFDRGEEPIVFEAAAAGEYRIGVTGTGKGEYGLRVLKVAPRGEADVGLLNAALRSTAAKRLCQENSAAARRACVEESRAAAEQWARLEVRPAELAMWIRVGAALHALSEYGEARAAFDRALPLSRLLGDRQSEGEILNNLGTGYWREGRVEEAIDSLEAAATIFKQARLLYEGAASASNLGILFRQTGEWQQALDHYLAALKTVRELGQKPGEAVLLNNIGVAYDSLGEPRKALDYLEQALATFRALGNGPSAGRVQALIGRMHLAAGRNGEALKCEQQALASARNSGDARSEAAALNNLGAVYEAQGNRTSARETFEAALSQFRISKDPRGEASVLLNLAHVESDPAKAMELLRRTLDLDVSIGSRDSQAEVLYRMARLARSTGSLAESRSSVEEALRIAESLRGAVAGTSLRATFFATKQDYYRFYIELLMRQGETATAFAASERMRGRSLLDTLSSIGADIQQGIAPALYLRHRAVQRQINYLADKGASREQLDRQFALLEAVESEIRGSSPHYAALFQPQPVTAAEARHSIVDRDSVLLEYALGSQGSFVWTVSAAGVKCYRLANRAVIEKAARRLLDVTGRRSRDAGTEWTASAAVLSRMVLGPASAELGARRLIVVADGVLQYVPWAALPGQDGLPLLRSHELVSLPSASVVPLLRREVAARKAAPRSAVIIADPVFSGDDPRAGSATGALPTRFPRLPFTRFEAAGIRSVLPNDAESLLDFDASKEAISDRRMKEFRMMHIASHTVLDVEHPELTAIVLSGINRHGGPVDGFLRLHEIYNMTLPMDLVVLSACQTGLGTELRGEGLNSLTRGFLYAGAARVIATLWRVDDAATAELMKRFYQGLYGPAPLRPAAALREAQLYVASQKRWADPFFWAGFVLQGEWR